MTRKTRKAIRRQEAVSEARYWQARPMTSEGPMTTTMSESAPHGNGAREAVDEIARLLREEVSRRVGMAGDFAERERVMHGVANAAVRLAQERDPSAFQTHEGDPRALRLMALANKAEQMSEPEPDVRDWHRELLYGASARGNL